MIGVLIKSVLVIFLIPFLSFYSVAGLSQQDSLLEFGAETFLKRCALCHGTEGYGDGLLSMALTDYPNTNLYNNRHGKTPDEIRNSIEVGGSQGKLSEEMPPWGNELNEKEIDSLVLFVETILNSPEKIRPLVETVSVSVSSVDTGKMLYGNYCSLCHGPNGEGDGKMARIIKDPPPFNLTKKPGSGAIPSPHY